MKCKAYVIRPDKQVIEETEYTPGSEDIHNIIGHYYSVGYAWPDRSTMYVDDEGLYRPGQSFFMLTQHPHQPMAGTSVVVGPEVEQGHSWYTEAPPFSLDELRSWVTFLTHGQVKQWFTDHADVPAISIIGADDDAPHVVTTYGDLWKEIQGC